MIDLTEYIAVLQECEKQCEEMLELESEKRKALTVNEGHLIETVVKNQQAALMKLEAIEKKRIQVQENLGFPQEMTAGELLAQLPQEHCQKAQLVQIAQHLKEIAQQVQEQNRQSIDLAKLDLRLIDSLRAKTSTNKASNAGLYKAGKAPQASNINTNTKFRGSF